MMGLGLKIEAAAVCHMGKVRTNNEDNLYFNHCILKKDHQGIKGCLPGFFSEESLSYGTLFGVFDGMGGQLKGELASYIMAEEAGGVERQIAINPANPAHYMKEACLRANERVCLEMNLMKGRMGTTASMLLFKDDEVYLCNIGDSPIFLFRDGDLRAIYEEHTDRAIREQLYGTESVEGKKFPLTQHIGIFPSELKIDPYTSSMPIRKDDCYLIGSDGLTDMVSVHEISNILSRPHASAQEIADELKEAALNNGGKDNTTIIVIRIHDGNKTSLLRKADSMDPKKIMGQEPDLISLADQTKINRYSKRHRSSDDSAADKNSHRAQKVKGGKSGILKTGIALIIAFLLGCTSGSFANRRIMEKDLKKKEAVIRKESLADRNETLYKSGNTHMDSAEYEMALDSFSLIDQDWESYDHVREKINQCRTSLKEKALKAADKRIKRKEPDKALEILFQAIPYIGEDKIIEEKIKQIHYRKLKQETTGK